MSGGSNSLDDGLNGPDKLTSVDVEEGVWGGGGGGQAEAWLLLYSGVKMEGRGW